MLPLSGPVPEVQEKDPEGEAEEKSTCTGLPNQDLCAEQSQLWPGSEQAASLHHWCEAERQRIQKGIAQGHETQCGEAEVDRLPSAFEFDWNMYQGEADPCSQEKCDMGREEVEKEGCGLGY